MIVSFKTTLFYLVALMITGASITSCGRNDDKKQDDGKPVVTAPSDKEKDTQSNEDSEKPNKHADPIKQSEDKSKPVEVNSADDEIIAAVHQESLSQARKTVAAFTSAVERFIQFRTFNDSPIVKDVLHNPEGKIIVKDHPETKVELLTQPSGTVEFAVTKSPLKFNSDPKRRFSEWISPVQWLDRKPLPFRPNYGEKRPPYEGSALQEVEDLNIKLSVMRDLAPVVLTEIEATLQARKALLKRIAILDISRKEYATKFFAASQLINNSSSYLSAWKELAHEQEVIAPSQAEITAALKRATQARADAESYNKQLEQNTTMDREKTRALMTASLQAADKDEKWAKSAKEEVLKAENKNQIIRKRVSEARINIDHVHMKIIYWMYEESVAVGVSTEIGKNIVEESKYSVDMTFNSIKNEYPSLLASRKFFHYLQAVMWLASFKEEISDEFIDDSLKKIEDLACTMSALVSELDATNWDEIDPAEVKNAYKLLLGEQSATNP